MDVPKNAEIQALTARNASQEWLFPNRPLLSQYTLSKKRRYSFGSVEVTLQMAGEEIRDIHFGGDFFGNAPLSRLEQRLIGARRQEMEARLASVPVEQYIFGMTAEELIALLHDTLGGE